MKQAARELGIDHKTLLRWYRAAGGSPEGQAAITQRASDAALARTRASNARQAEMRAAAREERLERLIGIARLALTREAELLERTDLGPGDLRAVTDAREKATRAIELLEGRATSRRDSGLEAFLPTLTLVFKQAVAIAPAELREAITRAFADGLRQVESQDVIELEAGEVDEGWDGAA